jgi:hypothetical protein
MIHPAFKQYSLALQKIGIMGYFDDLFSDKYEDELQEGKDYYVENGYRVMTEAYLTNRGYCCANGCRHCPYWPKAQKGNTNLRKNR